MWDQILTLLLTSYATWSKLGGLSEPQRCDHTSYKAAVDF